MGVRVHQGVKQGKGIQGSSTCIREALAGAVEFLAQQQGTGGWDVGLNPDRG